MHSGQHIYTYQLKLNPESSLFSAFDTIIAQLENGELASIDILSGDIKWRTKKSCDIAFSPSCTNELLLVPIKTNDSTHRVIAYKLSDGNIQWSFNRDILNFSLSDSISSSDSFSVLSGSIQLPTGESNHILAQLDNKTGSLNWEILLPTTIKRPLITPSTILSINNNQRDLLIFDPLTGEEVVQQSFYPLDSVLAINQFLIVFSLFDDTINIKCFG